MSASSWLFPSKVFVALSEPRSRCDDQLGGSLVVLQSFGIKIFSQITLSLVMGEEPAHWDVFDVGVISDLILNRSFSLSSFISCCTLQRICPICVKHEDDFIIILC